MHEFNLLEFNSYLVQSLERDCGPALIPLVRHHFQTIGKGVRPQVVHQLAQVLGVPPEKVVPWAAACEVLHNATLVHDDLQDGDEVRRGQSTIWRQYGPAQAINMGDYLLMYAPLYIEELAVSAEQKWQLAKLFSWISTRIVLGQTLEPRLYELTRSPSLEEEYFTCIRHKTADLFRLCAIGVSIIAGSEDDDLGDLWEQIGLVFQIQDDLLDLYGDKQRGERGCDIREGKISALVVAHLIRCPEDHDWVMEILRRPRDLTTTQDVESLSQIFIEKGARQHVLQGLAARIRNIRSSPSLERHPGLRDYVQATLRQILKPIAHLLNTEEENL